MCDKEGGRKRREGKKRHGEEDERGRKRGRYIKRERGGKEVK